MTYDRKMGAKPQLECLKKPTGKMSLRMGRFRPQGGSFCPIKRGKNEHSFLGGRTVKERFQKGKKLRTEKNSEK